MFTMASDQVRTGEQMGTITTLWRQLSNEIFMIVDDTPTLALGTCLRWSATKYALVNRWLLLQHCDVNYLIKYSWLLWHTHSGHLEHVYDGQRFFQVRTGVNRWFVTLLIDVSVLIKYSWLFDTVRTWSLTIVYMFSTLQVPEWVCTINNHEYFN